MNRDGSVWWFLSTVEGLGCLLLMLAIAGLAAWSGVAAIEEMDD